MKKPKQQTKKTEPAPDWVYSTPEDYSYFLGMVESGGDHAEDIDLTREEYITVKHFIAEMRGHDLTPPENTDELRLSHNREITPVGRTPKHGKAA
jgi:hypothetical protein